MCHDHKLKTVGFSPREVSFCSPSRLSDFLNGVCLHTSKDLFWRAKMTFDPTPQLIANCQTFTAATSSLQQEHFPLPCGSVGKINKKNKEGFTTLFRLSLLGAGGIPTMSP